MITIDDKIEKEVKAEVEREQLLRAQFAQLVRQFKADLPSELLQDIQEGELSSLQHSQLADYAATDLSQYIAVGLYTARFAPLDTNLSKDGRALLQRVLTATYNQKPHIANVFTDCVIDYVWPNITVRKELFEHVYEQDKKLNQALGPKNG